MKIVVLESYLCITNNLVNWDFLQEIGEYTLYDYTTSNDVYSRIKDAEIVLLSKTIIPDEVLHLCPKLKYIGVLATGYNIINTKLCKELGIIVTNVPAYSTDSVAQLIFAYILHFTNNVTYMYQSVQKDDWVNAKNFCYLPYKQTELANKNIGFIGYGKIAKKAIEIAKSFNMNPYIYSKNYHSEVINLKLNDLLNRCDFVCLTCPLTDETAKIVNNSFLSEMKKDAYLINTSRGGLVDEEALAYFLNNDLIKGAAVDVLSKEPPLKNNPLLNAQNIIITPHVAWGSEESILRLMQIVKDNLINYLHNQPINVVN